MNTIKNQIPEDKKAEWVNGVLTLVDKEMKDIRPVTERIKTFKDACRELGDEHPFVMQYRLIEASYRGEENISDFIAYLKLRIIAAALNEGWEPKFTEDEHRYFPYFVLYTEEEYNDLSDEQKSCVMYRSNVSANANGRVALAHTYYVSSNAYAYISSRLAFKTSELAIHAGEQFFEIWADFVFKAK